MAKKVKGKKRHIVVDTLGMMLALHVHPANIQDRHGVLPLLAGFADKFPTIVCLVADAAYEGEQTAEDITSLGPWRLDIVKRSKPHKFEILPKRWIVERTFAWMGRCRRLAKDFETMVRIAVAFIHLAMIRLMARRLARNAA
jgi:transposase